MFSTQHQSILASLAVFTLLTIVPCLAQEVAPIKDTIVTAALDQAATPAQSAPVATANTAPEPVYLVTDLMKKYNVNFSGNVTMDYFTSYIWRGQVLDHDSVVEPGVNFNLNDFSVGYWGNWDVNNNDSLNSGESDYYVSFSHSFNDFVSASIGHTWYGFPGAHTSSREVFGSISLPKLPLAPVLGIAHDYDEGRINPQTLERNGASTYYSITLSQSYPILPKYGTTLEFSSVFGYVDHQWLAGRGWHITPSLGLKIALASNITIQPTIGYNFPMQDLKDPLIGNQKNKFFSAVKTVYSF